MDEIKVSDDIENEEVEAYEDETTIIGPFDDIMDKKSMITTEYFQEWKKRLSQMDQKNINAKMIKKQYEKHFTRIEPLCRMKKGINYKPWRENIKKILDLLFRCMRHPDVISTGNIAVVLAYTDSLLNFLEEMSVRVSKLIDMDLLNTGHENILVKQQELINALVENLREPLSLDAFEKMVFEEENNG